MSQDIHVYDWKCPICGERKISLLSADESEPLGQAENALVSHIRATVGDGHGDEGDLPFGFDTEVAREHIVAKAEYDAAESAPSPSTKRPSSLQYSDLLTG